MRRALAFTLANAAAFQIGWFVCVLAGNFWATLYTSVVLLLHFQYTHLRLRDFVSLLVLLIIGGLHDLLLIHLNFIQFAGDPNFPPLWLFCLWALFAVTLNHSLHWIYSRPWLSSIACAVAGPLSYLAGVQLSTAQWSSPLIVVLPIMVALWLLMLPLHHLICMGIEPYVQRKRF
jgi:hypothetical protein